MRTVELGFSVNILCELFACKLIIYGPVINLFSLGLTLKFLRNISEPTEDLPVFYGSPNRECWYTYTALTNCFFTTGAECVHCAVRN